MSFFPRIIFCLFSLKNENVHKHHGLGGSPNTCYTSISHGARHRKMADFDPSGSQNPWTDFDETQHMVGYKRDPTSNDNFGGGSATWVVWQNVWLVTSLSFFSCKRHECIFIAQISVELHNARGARDWMKHFTTFFFCVQLYSASTLGSESPKPFLDPPLPQRRKMVKENCHVLVWQNAHVYCVNVQSVQVSLHFVVRSLGLYCINVLNQWWIKLSSIRPP